MKPTLSVVIPAHNEERVLGRTLHQLFDGAEPGEFEVIVAVNGCTDRTQQVAESFGDLVRTVVVPVAGKAAALNAGDRLASAFPRAYLDADVDVDATALRAVRDALNQEGPAAPLAAAPHVEFETAGCSWPVRAYYRVWTQLPFIAGGLAGGGLYAVSRAGRARFGDFPALLADDLFLQRLFRPDERATVAGVVRVRPPRRLGDLLRVKSRVYAGNRQYADALRTGTVAAQVASTPRGAGTVGTGAALRRVARDPRWWPELAAYVAVVTTAKARAESRVRTGRVDRWDQDASGRAP